MIDSSVYENQEWNWTTSNLFNEDRIIIFTIRRMCLHDREKFSEQEEVKMEKHWTFSVKIWEISTVFWTSKFSFIRSFCLQNIFNDYFHYFHFHPLISTTFESPQLTTDVFDNENLPILTDYFSAETWTVLQRKWLMRFSPCDCDDPHKKKYFAVVNSCRFFNFFFVFEFSSASRWKCSTVSHTEFLTFLATL